MSPEPDLPFVHDGQGPDVDPVTGDEAETFQPDDDECWEEVPMSPEPDPIPDPEPTPDPD